MKVMEESVLFAGNGFTYILAFLQTNEVMQYIEFALGILTSIVLIAYRLWVWWIKAKEDGKITKEELKEGVNILMEGKEDVEHKIKKGDNKDGDERANRRP